MAFLCVARVSLWSRSPAVATYSHCNVRDTPTGVFNIHDDDGETSTERKADLWRIVTVFTNSRVIDH